MDHEGCDYRRGSRRRGAALEYAIYQATLLELAEGGYARLAFDAVAARAGTGKSALYRRWSTRSALILDALTHTIPTGPGAVPHTGALRGDLIAVLTSFADALAGPVGGAMRALMAERHQQPELFEEIRQRIMEPRRQVFAAVLGAGVERGEVRPEAIHPTVIGVGPLMLMARYMETGTPVGPDGIAEIVDLALIPMLEPRLPANAVAVANLKV
jgi:AcrR family transcriptional regulator